MGIIADDVKKTREYGKYGNLLDPFLTFFSITWCRGYTKGKSSFSLFLLKPSNEGEKLFPKDREILLVATDYSSIFPRLISQIEEARRDIDQIRIDPILIFITGRTSELEQTANSLNSQMSQNKILTPFRNEDLESLRAKSTVEKQIRKYRQFKDLFDVAEPVSEDIYYFGRHDFTKDIVDRVRRGSNIGIFGLRKMGKTSLIQRVVKLLKNYPNNKLIYIDLQNAANYKMRWWEVLEQIAKHMGAQIKSPYNEENGAKRFTSFIRGETNSQRYILAFDEIEHIFPSLSTEAHWKFDFLSPWKTLRSVQNENKEKLSYVISGVNATVAETSHIEGVDNPLFSMVSVLYMPEFSNNETKYMIDTIGGYMGVNFDDKAITLVNKSFGGHPLLVRLASSKLYQYARTENPDANMLTVSESFTRERLPEIETDLHKFANHILYVLEKWYSDEYQMLKLLANDDIDTFRYMAQEFPEYASHLRSYRLIESSSADIKINILKRYLKSKNNVLKSPVEDVQIEKWKDVSEIRNSLEPLFRRIIRRTLMLKYGKSNWIKKVVESLPQPDRDKLFGLDADTILSERLYLTNLREIFNRHWDDFKFLETGDRKHQITKNAFLIFIDTINNNRQDAHAKQITEIELDALRISEANIRKVLNEYLD